jgi:hypothetical protein
VGAAATPGYSALTRQLRKSRTPPSVRGTSGVFVYPLLMSSLAVVDDLAIVDNAA